jgi:hypothetical protein
LTCESPNIAATDRYAPFHTKVINATVRDATHVLDRLRVKCYSRTTAVPCVDLTRVFTAPTDVKILSVRRGGCPRTPMAGKG